jgi:hypothetical protein
VVDDPTCLFCNEPESVAHLLFGCVVAVRTWEVVSQVLGTEVGSDYVSGARMWLCNKKFGIINMVTSAVCWCLWKLRNYLCFQDVTSAYVEKLENSGFSREAGWLRCCNHSAGEGGLATGANLPGVAGTHREGA